MSMTKRDFIEAFMMAVGDVFFVALCVLLLFGGIMCVAAFLVGEYIFSGIALFGCIVVLTIIFIFYE